MKGGGPRVTVRSLALRMVVARPGQAALVAVICLIACGAGIASHLAMRAAEDALASRAAVRHGTVSLTVAPSDPAVRVLPALSHGTGPRPGWIPQDLLEEADALSPALDLRLLPRIETTVWDGDSVRPLVGITPEDPAYRADPSPSGRTLMVALQARATDPVSWARVPQDAVVADEGSGPVWVRLAWLHALLGEPLVNTLVFDHRPPPAGPGATTPEVTPFTLAFDVESLLVARVTEDAAVRLRVRAWPQLVGYDRYVGVGSSAGLLRPLVQLVAAIAVAGAAAVAVWNRMRDVVVLRTLGFTESAVRGVFVREIAAASVAAAALVAVVIAVAGVAGAGFAGVSIGLDRDVARVLLGTALLPPLSAFLVMRRQLRPTLRTLRREADL